MLAEFPAYLRMGRGSELLPIFLRLLQDPEADVRAQSCGFAKARGLGTGARGRDSKRVVALDFASVQSQQRRSIWV